MNGPYDRVPSASLLSALMSILDIVVLERLPGGAFKRLSTDPAPSWFSEAFRGGLEGPAATLAQAFPVLDPFLSGAEAFWGRTTFGRLDGEAVVITGPGGSNLPIGTVAVALGGRNFLLLHRVIGFDDRQAILQRARERALAHEAVIRRIDDLRRPLSRVAGRLNELEASGGLTDAQRSALAAASAELAALAQVLEELPKPPPGTSVRKRPQGGTP
jgi:hypothetical protein